MKAKQITKETIIDLGVKPNILPPFKVGDTVAVSQRIKEGDKERLQVFEGDIIKIRKNGISSTFTVRKIGANSVGVERIFPNFSPLIESVKIIRSGKVCRAKLYYIRKRVGKAARVQEKVLTREQKASQNARTEA